MADFYSEPDTFEGTNAKECEVFVATIRKRALAQGKQRDNEWMALFASSYFVGDALYWYEDLEESIQNDWTRLRPALLAKFGRKGITPIASSAQVISGSASPNTIPSPAAAPLKENQSSSVRKGYLKVLNFDGILQGYISKTADASGRYESLSAVPSDALSVSFSATEEGPFEIQIIDAFKNPQVIDVLAIAWNSRAHDRCHKLWCACSASYCSLSTVTSKSTTVVEKNAWTISKDGTFNVECLFWDWGSSYERPGARERGDSGLVQWEGPRLMSGDDATGRKIVFQDVI